MTIFCAWTESNDSGSNAIHCQRITLSRADLRLQAFRAGFLRDEGINTALAKPNFIVVFEHPHISKL
jgi:hypothetical protein